jgi:methyl-accepting chemotaxis protein
VVQALVLTAALGLALALTRSITQPLNEAVELTQAIAQGDLTVTAGNDRHDEFGRLLSSVSTMAAQLRSLVSDVRTSVHSISTARPKSLQVTTTCPHAPSRPPPISRKPQPAWSS